MVHSLDFSIMWIGDFSARIRRNTKFVLQQNAEEMEQNKYHINVKHHQVVYGHIRSSLLFQFFFFVFLYFFSFIFLDFFNYFFFHNLHFSMVLFLECIFVFINFRSPKQQNKLLFWWIYNCHTFTLYFTTFTKSQIIFTIFGIYQ